MVTYRHFKMNSLKSAISLVTPNCYMASMRSKGCVLLCTSEGGVSEVSEIPVEGTDFQICLSTHGIDMLATHFTKITKPLYATRQQKGTSIQAILTTFTCKVVMSKDCENTIQDTVHTSQDSGFTIQPIKSVFRPTQILSHLGFVLNSRQMTFTVTSEKAQKIAQLCQQIVKVGVVTLRELAELIGQLVAGFPGIMYIMYQALLSQIGQSQHASAKIGQREL